MSGDRPGTPAATPDAGAPAADAGRQFERLLAVMDRLRSPGGCPWDGEQTHESLLRYLVEEAYEVVEAVEAPAPARQRRDDLVEELGDVLLQVVFHARIGEEHAGEERFDVSDVVASVTDKLVRRHPHVFPDHAGEAPGDGTPGAGAAAGDAAASPGRDAPSEAELAARWDAVKRAEKPHRTRIFDGIPPALPALAYGEKALSKARRHGVPGVKPVTAEPSDEQRAAEERELGEELLARLETASARGLDAERALRAAVRGFVRRHDGPVPG